VNLKVGTKRLQLGLAAQAAGADVRALRQAWMPEKLTAQKTSRGFSRVVMAAISKSAASSVGQIFQAVHG